MTHKARCSSALPDGSIGYPASAASEAIFFNPYNATPADSGGC